MLDNEDFNFGYKWCDDGEVMYVNHLWVADEHRGNGSLIIETLVRIAYGEGADVIEVSIGGGERAEAFLKKNGFHIIRRRYYEEETAEYFDEDWAYGIDAVRRV